MTQKGAWANAQAPFGVYSLVFEELDLLHGLAVVVQSLQQVGQSLVGSTLVLLHVGVGGVLDGTADLSIAIPNGEGDDVAQQGGLDLVEVQVILVGAALNGNQILTGEHKVNAIQGSLEGVLADVVAGDGQTDNDLSTQTHGHTGEGAVGQAGAGQFLLVEAGIQAALGEGAGSQGGVGAQQAGDQGVGLVVLVDLVALAVDQQIGQSGAQLGGDGGLLQLVVAVLDNAVRSDLDADGNAINGETEGIKKYSQRNQEIENNNLWTQQVTYHMIPLI